MLGLNKGFVIALFLACVIGYGTKSWQNFFVIIGVYAIFRIAWNLFT